MRIIFLSTDRKIFDSASEVAGRMVEYGKHLGELEIVVFAGPHEPLRLSENVQVYSTKSCCRLMYIPDAFRLIIKLNKIVRADWLSAQDPFETGLAAWLANLAVKTKLQMQLHTDVFSPFFAQSSILNRFRVQLAKFLLPRADRIRTVSEKITRSLSAPPLKIIPAKITTLPVFIDFTEIANRPISVDLKKKYPQFERIVIMASRFAPEKDFPTALEAFRRFMLKWKKVGLIIVGEGPELGRINELIRRFGVSNNVVVESWNRDIFSYFRTADVYLLSSLFEGYGRTLAEATFAGTPFISTDVGCARELLACGARGYVVPVGDREAIFHALDDLVNKEEVSESDRSAVKNLPCFVSKERFFEIFSQSFEA